VDLLWTFVVVVGETKMIEQKNIKNRLPIKDLRTNLKLFMYKMANNADDDDMFAV
jgi:hypothetical protein